MRTTRTYTATAPDGTKLTRNSKAFVFTHAVIAQYADYEGRLPNAKKVLGAWVLKSMASTEKGAQSAAVTLSQYLGYVNITVVEVEG